MPQGGSGGFLLSLLTESFAVRALVGSLVAFVLAMLALRSGRIRSSAARRVLLLTPVLVAGLVGLASLRDAEAYLPQLWVATAATGPTGQLLDLLGDVRGLSTERGVDLLAALYGVITAALLGRRISGLVVVRRLLQRARPVPAGHGLSETAARLAHGLGITSPTVLLLPRCPGGAFTARVRRPVIVIDPALLDGLDQQEQEALLAHELAHVARRDTLCSLLVGAFRDLTFFLPPIHLAAHRLRLDQESAADELASTATRRPAALASSILKVWDVGRAERQAPAGACAALGTGGGGLRLPSLLPGALARASAGTPMTAGARTVTERVERLLDRSPAASHLRRRVELAVGALALVVAGVLALAGPWWVATNMNTYSLSFGYLAAAPTTTVEAPALATFRALTSSAGAGGAEAAVAVLPRRLADPACPCLETRAQLRGGAGESSAERASMLWAADGVDAWQLPERPTVRARPLLTLSERGPQVGVFLVAKR